MKKLFFALLFCVMSVASLHAQIAYAPNGINYGSGLIIKETYGAGAPTSACSTYVRYWQTDATAPASPMWQCNLQSGTMVNLNSTTGGASFAVTTTAATLQTMAGALSSTYFQVSNADTTLWRCGTKCLSLGSNAVNTDGLFQAFSLSGNTNGVLDAAQYSGSDIGAKVNAAAATCIVCDVYVPESNYSYSTGIAIPSSPYGIHLILAKNAVLTYTGSGCGITTPSPGSGGGNIGGVVVEGGTLIGTSAAACGVHTSPGQNARVTGMLIKDFTGGDGIWVDGTNVVSIDHNRLNNNLNNIHLTGNDCNSSTFACVWTRTGSTWVQNTVSGGAGGFAPNRVSVHDNNISSAIHWGILEMDVVGGPVSQAFNNSYHDNDLEANGTGGSSYGAALVGFTRGSTYESNYFEAEQRGIVEGCVSGDSGVAIPTGYTSSFCGTADKTTVAHNFFNDGAGVSEVALLHANSPSIVDNAENGNAPCLINLVTALGNFNIAGNQIYGTGSEVCQNGTAGGDLINYIMHGDSAAHAAHFTGTVQIDNTVNSNLNFNLNTNHSTISAGGCTIVGTLGGITIWQGISAPAGSCGSSSSANICFTPTGTYTCNTTWRLITTN